MTNESTPDELRQEIATLRASLAELALALARIPALHPASAVDEARRIVREALER